MMRRNTKRIHDELVRWLQTGEFEYFVTLTIPTHSLTPTAARDRLRRWGAYMNRRVVGSRWLKRPDEHLFVFAALEKPKTNLHWHLLVRVPGDGIDEDKRQLQKQRFETEAELRWRMLVPSGTVDIRAIRDRGAAKYVAKDIAREIEYSYFVLPDEFRNR